MIMGLLSGLFGGNKPDGLFAELINNKTRFPSKYVAGSPYQSGDPWPYQNNQPTAAPAAPAAPAHQDPNMFHIDQLRTMGRVWDDGEWYYYTPKDTNLVYRFGPNGWQLMTGAASPTLTPRGALGAAAKAGAIQAGLPIVLEGVIPT